MMRRLLAIGLGLLAVPLAAETDGAHPRQIGEPAGSGRYQAIAETWADAPAYTIYRPLEPANERLPLVLWGNGACRDNGLSARHFLREIASHGYLVIANGAAREESPARTGLSPSPAPAEAPRAPSGPAGDETSVTQLLAAIEVADRVNGSAGPMQGMIDTSRIAVMGHSCGGLQALAAGADPRVTTVVAFASGVYNRPGSGRSGVQITKADLAKLHTPVAYILGGPEDIAFPNGSDDFDRIGHVPVMLASLPVGHGGTFPQTNGGDWARVGTAWLDWQLKGDRQAARWFVDPDCRLCTTFGWTVQRKQFPGNP